MGLVVIIVVGAILFYISPVAGGVFLGIIAAILVILFLLGSLGDNIS